MNLYQHQKKFFLANPNKAMLVWGLGSGKTRSACEWAKTRSGKTLIVCPKGLKVHWSREAEKWGLSEYQVISKEYFKMYAQDLECANLIVDEADHFFSANFKSQLSKSMRSYIKINTPNMLLLSGTPVRSSAWNVFTAATLLGYKWNYLTFKRTFFTEVRMGYRWIPIPKKGTEKKLRELVEKISDVFRVEDAFDIPEQRDEVIESGESKLQKDLHQQNEEVQPIVRFTRDNQIEAGAGCADEKTDNKLELILGYAQAVDKLLIVVRYREQLERYAVRLRGEGYTVLELHGGVENRQEVVDKAELLKKCVVLITGQVCEGYELPSFDTMVFASMDYSYRNFCQIKGRILRMNFLHKNLFIFLLAGKTDHAIMEAMENKQDMDVLAYYKTL